MTLDVPQTLKVKWSMSQLKTSPDRQIIAVFRKSESSLNLMVMS